MCVFKMNRLWGWENYLICANVTVCESKISFRREIRDSRAHKRFIRIFKNVIAVQVKATEF